MKSNSVHLKKLSNLRIRQIPDFPDVWVVLEIIEMKKIVRSILPKKSVLINVGNMRYHETSEKHNN